MPRLFHVPGDGTQEHNAPALATLLRGHQGARRQSGSRLQASAGRQGASRATQPRRTRRPGGWARSGQIGGASLPATDEPVTAVYHSSGGRRGAEGQVSGGSRDGAWVIGLSSTVRPPKGFTPGTLRLARQLLEVRRR